MALLASVVIIVAVGEGPVHYVHGTGRHDELLGEGRRVCRCWSGECWADEIGIVTACRETESATLVDVDPDLAEIAGSFVTIAIALAPTWLIQRFLVVKSPGSGGDHTGAGVYLIYRFGVGGNSSGGIPCVVSFMALLSSALALGTMSASTGQTQPPSSPPSTVPPGGPVEAPPVFISGGTKASITITGATTVFNGSLVADGPVTIIGATTSIRCGIFGTAVSLAGIRISALPC